MKKDRNLLFGMLAVSTKKVRPDKLAALARQTQAGPEADLGDSLVQAGLLSQADRDHIDSLVEMSLKENDGDASATIQALGKDPDKLATVVDSLDAFLDAFERNAANPATRNDSEFAADSLLGGVDTDAPATGPMELDSLVEDPAKTRITHSGNTNDKGSIGYMGGGDAPDSFFQSIGNTDTQIMSPVQAAAELDESQIVPAVAEHKGRYETIRDFAKGGMGQITLVHDTHLGRDVALKQLLQRNIIPETRPGAPTTAILTIPIIARFLQEARVTGQLEHPSIVPVYELGYRADGSLYYTMKLVRGRSMHDVLKDAKDIRDRLQLLTHFLDLCQAISYAHSRGVIHRDLKPMNIMIGEFGETVVIDWGIAKVKGQDDIHAKGLQETFHAMRVSSTEATAKTMYGQTIGSPYFMPAEQAMGRTDLIDERSDVYSLGAVLYTILTGQMPYAGNNVREFMGKVGQVEPRPVRELEPLAPPELAAVVRKAMALVPENRYQSAKELTDEVQRFLSGGNVSAYDYSLMETAKRLYKKHKVKINVSIGAAAALAVFGVIYSVNITFQKNRAEAAEKEALAQRDEANTQRTRAEDNERQAKEQRDNAQQQLYYANIANTKFNINEQQMAKARELLASCEPAELRQWEWGHLQAETHADLMTLNRGGRFTAFTADGTGLLTATPRGTLSLHDLNTGDVIHEFVNRAGNGTAVAASADVSRVAIRGDKAVQVWDVNTKAELLRYDEVRETEYRHHLALSANGKYVAALNATDSNRAFTARVWDVDSKAVVLEVEGCLLDVFSTFFSPDGSLLFIARHYFNEEMKRERLFEVYSIPSGEVKGSYTIPADSAVSYHTGAFSPDNTTLAVGTENSLEIWSTDSLEGPKDVYPKTGDEGSGQEDKHYRFYTPDLISFSADGAYVAAGTNDGHLVLIETSTGKLYDVEKAHKNIVRGARFSPDGKRLASVADDRTLRLWSVPELRPIRTFRGHDKSIYTLGFSADGLRIATSSPEDGIAKIWDLSADLEFAPSEIPSFTTVTYHPGTGLVAGSGRTEVFVWDARTGHRRHTLAAHGDASKAIGFNPSGTLLASLGKEGDSDALRVWDVASGELKYTIPTGQVGGEALWFLAGDRQVLVKSGTPMLRVDLAAGSVTPLFAEGTPLAGKRLQFVEVNATGTHLTATFKAQGENEQTLVYHALAGDGAPVTLDITNAVGARTFFTPTEGELIISQDDPKKENDIIVRGIGSSSLSRWKIADGSLTEPMRAHGNRVNALAFSPDGAKFVTASQDSTAVVWNNADLTQAATLRGHSGSVSNVAFSPDGNRVVTGGSDGTFKIFEVVSGTQILTVNDAAVNARGQVIQPAQIAFSADGLQLATITKPPVSPMVLHAFSTNTADYPAVSAEGEGEIVEEGEAAPASAAEQAAAQLEKQLEAYKRQYWRK